VKKSSQEIINKYHGLSRIEDSFRIIKSDLDGRPVYVRTKEHINAHFLVCFITLTMMRLLQYRILRSIGESKDADGWKQGISAKALQAGLKAWQVDAQDDGVTIMTEPDMPLSNLFRIIGIETAYIGNNLSDFQQLKYNISKTKIIHTIQ
jgi:transposase